MAFSYAANRLAEMQRGCFFG
ncbi:hypothetical protein NGH09_23490 [Escherichia coli]|nr:hypothetical protein [Escherichia coli]MEB8120485.1 hypothetical protein [Escherichia coli]